MEKQTTGQPPVYDQSQQQQHQQPQQQYPGAQQQVAYQQHDPNQIYQYQQQGTPSPYAQGQQHPQPVYSDPNQAVYPQSPAEKAGTPAPGQAIPPQEFQSAVPLSALNRGPAPVDCPMCRQRGLTTVGFKTGNTTHVWGLVAFCLACLCCVPYLMNSTKDVEHKCSKCSALLATWHRSGNTEVHAHA